MTTPQYPPMDHSAEWQSAWYDQEPFAPDACAEGTIHARLSADSPLAPDEPGLTDSAMSQRLEDYRRLSTLLQALPVETLPANFAGRVLDQLAAGTDDVIRRPETVSSGLPRRLFWARVPMLAASVLGLGMLAALWGTGWPPDLSQERMVSSKRTEATPSGRHESGASRSSGAGMSSLPTQLDRVPQDAVAIVTILLPHQTRSASTSVPTAALAEKVFGDHDISRFSGRPPTDGTRESPDNADSPRLAAPNTAGEFHLADGDDPMLLLVVGESEAIVNSVEDLLHEWELSKMEDEITMVARTELDQHSDEMKQSLGQYLAEIEHSWGQSRPESVVVANRASQRRKISGNSATEEVEQATSEDQSRSRGSMTWLPNDSLTQFQKSWSSEKRDLGGSVAALHPPGPHAPATVAGGVSGGSREVTPPVADAVSPKSVARSSEPPSASKASQSATPFGPQDQKQPGKHESLDAGLAEGRQIRRVLIRIVPQRAG